MFVRRGCGIRARVSLLNQVARERARSLTQLLGCRPDRRGEIGLMKLMPAFGRGSDEGDPKAASPIPEEVGETGCFVILVRPQLRIGNDVDGYEEEAICEFPQR